jgi:hypothetical protein
MGRYRRVPQSRSASEGHHAPDPLAQAVSESLKLWTCHQRRNGPRRDGYRRRPS